MFNSDMKEKHDDKISLPEIASEIFTVFYVSSTRAKCM